MLVGQISGIIFVFGMDIAAGDSPSKTPAMIVFIVLMIINIFLNLKLRESKLVKADEI